MDTVPSLYFARRKKRNCSDLGCANELELLLGGQHGRKSLSRVRGKTGAGCWQVMVASPPWLNGFRCFPIIAVARSTPWQLLSTTHAPGEGHGLGILLPGRWQHGWEAASALWRRKRGHNNELQPRLLLSACLETGHVQHKKPWHSRSTHTEDPNLRHGSPISSSFITKGGFWQFRSPPACLSPRFG